MDLLELLKYRRQVAEKYTKPFHEEVKACVDSYELADSEKDVLQALLNVNKRYEFRIPYIFATHDSMLSSMFDRVPELVLKGRGLNDDDKGRKVEAAYNYLVDILNIEQFMTTSAWWFILIGFVSANIGWKTESAEYPLLDDAGLPQFDENGEPLTRVEYTYNDPTLETDDPLRMYWSPESKFDERSVRVPYYFREELMELDEVKAVYGKKVDADATLKIDGLSDSDRDDIKRARVYFYYGTIPEDNKKDVKDWVYNKYYHIVFTNNVVLHKEVLDIPKCSVGRWHGIPTRFFGFGIARLLREFQKELSIRRGQQVRYADLAAFPKIAIEETSKVDENSLLDPRAQPVLTYRDKAPEYLVPPDMSQTVMIAEQKAREDAQFVSGMLDLSKGAQDSTVVKTAYGQSMFAEAAEKRIKQAKRQFARYYKDVVIKLLKLAQQNWDDEKLLSITDNDGTSFVSVSKEDLSDIDFDKDIDIDLESISVNKDVIRAQAIELYNMTKDDPLIKRDMLFKDLLRFGFDKKNPEQYIDQSALEQMNNPQMAAEPAGSVAPEEQPMPQPTPNPSVPSNQSQVMGMAQ